ncbi:MAG: FHA domain-containing protein [Butyrivibrio sp.]|nr:FHA domain-containing protein [Butyrivibrio sp.]
MQEFLDSIFSSGAAKWTWAVLVAIATVVAPIFSSFIVPAAEALKKRKNKEKTDDGGTNELKRGDVIVTLIPLNNPKKVYQGFGHDDNVDIGTGSTCELVLDCDDAISMRHCCISVKEERFFLKDYNSTNGTYLNGKLIDKVMELFPEDEIVLRLGETDFKVDILAYKEAHGKDNSGN